MVDALLTRERGRRVICFDPNPRPQLAPDLDAMARWIGGSDIVKVSEDDLAWTMPGLDPAEVAQRWLALGPTLVVVTRGADGVYAVGPAGEYAATAPPVEVVDTVGAGDAFTAGLLAALHRRGPVTAAGLRDPGPRRARRRARVRPTGGRADLYPGRRRPALAAPARPLTSADDPPVRRLRPTTLV